MRLVAVASVCLTLILAPALSAQEETPKAAVEEPAQTPAPWYDDITFNAFASFAYSYNFEAPDSGRNSLRVFDFDDNTFKIDVAEVVVQKPAANPGDAGFRVDLTAGSSIPRIAASAGLFRDDDGQAEDFDLQQAYVVYNAPIGSGLSIAFGKHITHMGAEVIEGYDGWNDNYSRGILFGYAIPFTHTGLRASYTFSPQFSATGYLVNGWDNARDNNSGKTFGTNFTITPNDTFTLYVNTLVGPEQTDDSNSIRKLLDFVAVWKATPRTTIMANIDLAAEEDVAADGESGNWKGFALYAKQDITDRFSLALRGELFDDEDGLRTGSRDEYQEFTITPSYRLSKNAVARAEIRHDVSDEDYFERENGEFGDNQTTLAFNVLYSF